MKKIIEIIEILKAILAKFRKPIHVEVSVTSEKPVNPIEKVEVPVTYEKVLKPTKRVETIKKVETVETTEKPAKRRGRPRKVKAE